MSLSLLAFSLSFPSVIYKPSEGSLKNERTSLSSGTSAIIVPYYVYYSCSHHSLATVPALLYKHLFKTFKTLSRLYRTTLTS